MICYEFYKKVKNPLEDLSKIFYAISFGIKDNENFNFNLDYDNIDALYISLFESIKNLKDDLKDEEPKTKEEVRNIINSTEFNEKSVNGYINFKNNNIVPLHNLYLNIDSSNLFLFINYFINECIKENVSYDILIKEEYINNTLTNSLTCHVPFIIKSDNENLGKYVEIINNIKNNYPNIIINEPPLLSGKLGLIGYESATDEPLKIRNDLIINLYNYMKDEYKNWFYKNKDLKFLNYDSHLKFIITEAFSLFAFNIKKDISDNNIKDEDVVKKYGIKSSDLDNLTFINDFANNCMKVLSNKSVEEIENIKSLNINTNYNTTINFDFNYVNKALSGSLYLFSKYSSSKDSLNKILSDKISKEQENLNIDYNFSFDKEVLDNLYNYDLASLEEYINNYMKNNESVDKEALSNEVSKLRSKYAYLGRLIVDEKIDVMWKKYSTNYRSSFIGKYDENDKLFQNMDSYDKEEVKEVSNKFLFNNYFDDFDYEPTYKGRSI